jgi:hypothetical protein
MLTKQNFLKQAGGNTPQQIFDASKKLNLGASDVDSIMGYKAGTAQSFLDSSGNLKPAQAATTASAPTKTLAAQAASAPKQNAVVGMDTKTGLPNMKVYAAPTTGNLTPQQQQLRDFATNSASGKTGNLTDQDAMQIYSMAASNGLTKQQVVDATGVPADIIDTWMSKNGLAWPAAQTQTPKPTSSTPMSEILKNAISYTPERVTMDPSDTVENRVANIISADSPLMQMNETRSLQRMNARGLRDSTMAIEAGQRAVIDAATPIATQDAATSAQMKIANQQAYNTAEQQRVDGLQNILEIVTSAEQQLRSEGSLLDQKASIERSLQAADQAFQINLQSLQGAQQLELDRVRTQNEGILQGNNLAAQVYSNAMIAMAEVLAQPDLDEAAKQSQVTKITQMLDNGLALIANSAKIDFSELLSFD